MQKTNKDIFIAFFNHTLGPVLAQQATLEFERLFVRGLGLHAQYNEVVTDAYYEQAMAAIPIEAPHFLNYVLNAKLPPLTPAQLRMFQGPTSECQ